MSRDQFRPSRPNGRSDSQVLCDAVLSASPGQVFTFDELADILGKDAGRDYDRTAVRSVVARCYPVVLKSTSRALHNVRGVGYRVVPATEQREVAQIRKRRSDVQLKRAVQTLQHVRWEEMDPNSRAAHEGQLVILSAVMTNQMALEKRIARTEEAIRKILGHSDELQKIGAG